MILTLVIVGRDGIALGSTARKTFRATGGSIGRLRGNDLVLDDPHVSRRHAEIRCTNGRFYIVDMSVNGVFVSSPSNRLVRDEPYEIKSDDIILIGPYEIRASIAGEPTDDPTGPVSLAEPFGSSDATALPWPVAPVSPQPAVPPRASPEELDPLRIPASDASPPVVPAPNRSKAETSLGDTHFAAFAPASVERGCDFMLDVWAYATGYEGQAFELGRREGAASLRGSKRALKVELGTTLTIWIDVPGFRAASAVESVVWNGTLVNATFVLQAEQSVANGMHIGTARIMSGAVPIGLLHLELNVGAKRDVLEKVGAVERKIQNVFASYASEDRLDVLQWARGAELVGVEVFLDVLRLREGTDWSTELMNHVSAKDVFCLFWSEPARRSNWVEREWRYALSKRGLDYIHPVPLADPRVVTPPVELQGKQFGGTTFLIQMYEQKLKADGAPI